VAKEVARKALNRQLSDRTDGALYFHHRNVSPAWASAFAKTAEIDDLVFYKPAN
jgi:spore germination cell wall hydrolase CwlJ-like protein